jgi:hypothetical protein
MSFTTSCIVTGVPHEHGIRSTRIVELNVPRVFRIARVDPSPPTNDSLLRCSEPGELSLTVHNDFHIVHEAVDDLQDLRLSHTGLFHREPVQSPEYAFDLAVP